MGICRAKERRDADIFPGRAPLACFNQDQKLTRDNHRSSPVFPVSYLPYHLSEIRGKCQDRAPVPL